MCPAAPSSFYNLADLFAGDYLRKNARQKAKSRSVAIGFLAAVTIFVLLGLVTVLVPNSIFIRMTPVYFYDYAFLILTSVLSGAYVGLWHHARTTSSKCNFAAGGGAIGGLFSFGCAICNKLLILLLGLSGVAAYFMPIQPLLGIVSVAVLAYAVHAQFKLLSKRR